MQEDNSVLGLIHLDLAKYHETCRSDGGDGEDGDSRDVEDGYGRDGEAAYAYTVSQEEDNSVLGLIHLDLAKYHETCR